MTEEQCSFHNRPIDDCIERADQLDLSLAEYEQLCKEANLSR